MRCGNCKFFVELRDNRGSCTRIGEINTDGIIVYGVAEYSVSANFGCVLYENNAGYPAFSTRFAKMSQSNECDCHSCLRARHEIPMHLVTCPKCGNKRCPKADNHIFKCTQSNEPGQIGELE